MVNCEKKLELWEINSQFWLFLQFWHFSRNCKFIFCKWIFICSFDYITQFWLYNSQLRFYILQFWHLYSELHDINSQLQEKVGIVRHNPNSDFSLNSDIFLTIASLYHAIMKSELCDIVATACYKINCKILVGGGWLNWPFKVIYDAKVNRFRF